MGTLLLLVLVLLAAAVAVAIVADRLRQPVPLALLLLGLLVGLIADPLGLGGLRAGARAVLSPTLFFDLLLPPIIFEAALRIRVTFLRRYAGIVLFLALFGVLFTTGFTGLVLADLGVLPVLAAFLLAAILSATDPIAVVALFRRLRVPPGLSTVVESEALFNDAVAVTLFAVVLSLINAGSFRPGPVLAQFAWQMVGGVGVGAGAGGLLFLARRGLGVPTRAIPLTLIGAFGSFAIADALAASGIIAAAVAGIAAGHGMRAVGPGGELPRAVDRFWNGAVYGANAVVFLAMGLLFALPTIWGYLPLVIGVFGLLTIGRAALVFGYGRMARRIRIPPEPPTPWYPVIALSGVRGAIPIVLALSLYESPVALGAGTISTLVATVLGVVLVSVVVQSPLAEWYVERRFVPGGSH